MMIKDEITHAEIERVLVSHTFRNAEVLRALLRFLGEKSISGEAEHLKEYTIGIEALGRPPLYDPRQDSSVRIQVGRLRQKLAEYYREEGKDDPVIIDVPKGQFKLTCQPASRRTESPSEAKPVPSEEASTPASPLALAVMWRRAAILLGTFMVFASAWGVYSAIQLSSAGVRSVLSPELKELWKPFMVPNRPLIIAIENIVFASFEGGGVYRDRSTNTWADAGRSVEIERVRKAFGSPAIRPIYFTNMGDVSAAFRLGKILTAGPMTVSISRSREISQEQLTDSNVVFVGSSRYYNDKLQALPVKLEFVMDARGVQNLHPRSGEPARMDNHGDEKANDGEVYALITHAPGPLGSGDIETFSANSHSGTLAAVQWFTEPAFAKILVSKLRRPNGRGLPRYFQIVLDVRYRDGIPTDESYVMHRELVPQERPSSN